MHVETVLNADQAAQLAREGVDLELKEIDGMSVAQRATLQAAAGYNVYKKYSGPGGLQEEYEQVARRHPLITKLVRFGKTTQGKDIVALKVSLGAPLLKDGLKPSIVYFGAQHAREWITPEMNRRLMHHVVDNYLATSGSSTWSTRPSCGSCRSPTRTAMTGRSSRASGSGARTCATTTATARSHRRRRRSQPQLRLQVGLRQRGLLAEPTSQTYRGPGPNSEPESKALDALFKRVGGFTEFVNYHSAAELLLYGVGWQVATPTPDDLLGIAMTGDDANPAVPGYDPDIAAELYTTNGEVDSLLGRAVRVLRHHARDVDLRGRVGVRPRRPVGARGLRLAPSSSPTTRS